MAKSELTVLKGGMLRYRYDVSPELGFDFYMLCEVGEPYQQWFRDEIKARGILFPHNRGIETKGAQHGD